MDGLVHGSLESGSLWVVGLRDGERGQSPQSVTVFPTHIQLRRPLAAHSINCAAWD